VLPDPVLRHSHPLVAKVVSQSTTFAVPGAGEVPIVAARHLNPMLSIGERF
jgi:hypothetical protein